MSATKHSSSNLISGISSRLSFISAIVPPMPYSSMSHAVFSKSHHHSLSLFKLFLSRSTLFVLLYGLMSLIPSQVMAEESSQKSSEQSSAQPSEKPQTITGHKTIGISQIVEHPALDAVRLGVIQELKDQGFIEGKNLSIQYENAQGNIATASQIASKFLGEKLDLAVAISTPSAQTLFFAAQKQNHRTPIVFSAVSDPGAAKLISSTYPITGVTDAPNLDGLLEVINKLMPNLRILGLMYNPAEANSVSTITKLKKILKEQGIIVHEVTVNKTADVAQAMHSLIGKVDALYFPQDNTVVAAIETVVNIAQQSSPTLPVILPIFSSDPALMKRGILAAVGFDYYDLGQDTGKVVAKILQGTDPKKIPIENPSHLKAVINQTLAKQLGLTLPTKLQYSEVQFID